MSVLAVGSKPVAPYVYIRRPIPEEYINKLRKVCSQVIVEPWIYGEPEPEPSIDLSKCNVIVTLGLHDTLGILKTAPNVKWVQSLSVGLDSMLHEDVRNSDIIITNTKGCTSIPIAEHTIALLTSLARGLPTMVRNQLAKNWVELPLVELSNATVGIVGYGEIGLEIAKRCKALEMRVIGCRRNPKKSKPMYEPADLILGIDQIDQILSQSDFLVLALPSTKETYHFLNQERMNKMKRGSFLINVGRGNTIVEDDLIEYLGNGKIAEVALDVFDVEPLPEDHPFWQLENVIVSPHTAYYSPKTLERNMELLINNLQRFALGKPLLNVVDKQLGY